MKRVLLVVGIVLAVGLFAVGCKKEEPAAPVAPEATSKVEPAATEAIPVEAAPAAAEAVPVEAPAAAPAEAK